MFALLPVLVPVAFGVLLFAVNPLSEYRRLKVCVGIALLVSSVVTLLEAFSFKDTIILWRITDSVSLSLGTDKLGTYFAVLMCFMFTTVGFYAMDYMKHENDTTRFFAFYLCVFGVLNGIYLSTNLITMYLFYEMMTLLSLPLVLHSLSKEAIAAGYKYLYYSIAGAFLSLISIFFVYQYASSYEFVPGGYMDAEKLAGDNGMLLAFVFLAIIGFGCKAGLFPLQDWLPTAHPVAPAPASAVLSGVITKSGVIAIIRLVYYSIGIENLKGTWVQYAWIVLSLLTVFLGSMMAYGEKVIKKRLAYSTVSQVSYVLFGLSLMNEAGFLGAMLHIVFHSVIKDDLFLVSGAIIHNAKITTVDKLKGIGKKMPVSIWCFTFSSIALIGIPPASGFVSKWFLGTGALASDIGAFRYLGPAILLISALLTAGYLLPVTVDGFFPGKDYEPESKCEVGLLSLIPIIVLAVLAVILGIFPSVLEGYIGTVISELGL